MTEPHGAGTRSLGPTANVDRLPTFMIIGAAKAGTTSLHHYLDQHPEISMSRPKETNFFERPDYRDAIAEYERCFADGTRARGEASVHYTCFPVVPGVPERISSILPDLRLIYCVRDPVDRAVGHYYERYQSGVAPKSIAAAFADLDDSKVWVAASRYATQLDRYLEHFPRSHLTIVDERELRADRAPTLRALFDFLGVDPDFSSPRFDDELNVRHGGRERMTSAGRIMRRSPVAGVARRALPPAVRERIFGPVRKRVLRPVPRESLPDEARSRLIAFLREDIDRFRAIADRPFDQWSL